jgi:hypothetical protein
VTSTKPRRSGLKGDPSTFFAGAQEARKSAKFISTALSGLSAIFEPQLGIGYAIPRFSLAQGGSLQLQDEFR